jgi:hypothetical protein
VVSAAFPNPLPSQTELVVRPALYACLAVPAYLVILFLAVAAFVAFTSRKRPDIRRGDRMLTIEDEDREWLGRHGAWLLISAIGWAALSALVLFGPLLLLWSPKLLGAVGGISGLLAALGGRSALTPGTDENRTKPTWKTLLLEHSLSIGALLFICVLIAGLSFLTSGVLASLPPGWMLEYRSQALLVLAWLAANGYTVWVPSDAVWTPWSYAGQFAILYHSPLRLVLGLAFVLGLVGYGMSRAINLNKFSLHAAYRARLIRAFLGTSRVVERQENPFTGFDPQDNVQMHELRPGLLKEISFRPGGLTRFATRLKNALAPDTPDVWSKIVLDCLDGDTRGLLTNHQEGNPPSQTLKRKLLEDLNRLLEAGPLYKAAHVATASVSDRMRHLLEHLWQPHVPHHIKSRLDQQSATATLTNNDVETLMPPLGCGDTTILLNRVLLETAFPDELEQLPYPPPPYKLMHVINVALNLVGGERLAWQHRKAESCTISPLHSGSHYVGYRRSRYYGGSDGISLGTAVTISGAAVSSNMGYHSSSLVTFVLTLLNARLGWWLGNPGIAGGRTFRNAYPRSSIWPVLLEAFGLTDDSRPEVLLSDGGHFDNLGLYEMVLRRCHFIVAVDGSQDADGKFADLGSALRKIRIDLGIPIEFHSIDIFPRTHPAVKDGHAHACGKYCAIGCIQYSAVDPDAPSGVLVYIKPAVYGREPRDVIQYAATDPDFPHQSTLDQLFDEPQFESYRALGLHIINELCSGANGPLTLAGFVQALSPGLPPSPAPEQYGRITPDSTDHTATAYGLPHSEVQTIDKGP